MDGLAAPTPPAGSAASCPRARATTMVGSNMARTLTLMFDDLGLTRTRDRSAADRAAPLGPDRPSCSRAGCRGVPARGRRCGRVAARGLADGPGDQHRPRAHRTRRSTASAVSTSPRRCAATRCPTASRDPDPYLRAAELLGVAAAECLAVEDSPNGALAAAAGGRSPCSSCRATCRCRPGRAGCCVRRSPDSPSTTCGRDTPRHGRVARRETVGRRPLRPVRLAARGRRPWPVALRAHYGHRVQHDGWTRAAGSDTTHQTGTVRGDNREDVRRAVRRAEREGRHAPRGFGNGRRARRRASTLRARRSSKRPARCGSPPSTRPTTRSPRRSRSCCTGSGLMFGPRPGPRRCLQVPVDHSIRGPVTSEPSAGPQNEEGACSGSPCPTRAPWPSLPRR